MRLGVAVFGTALASILALAMPAEAKNTLRWASQGDALSLDPMAQNEGPTIAMNALIMETLVGRDREMKLEPQLAVSWTNPQPDIWRFKLRENVKFHDGTPFTAEDVVFSLKRAMGPTSDFRTSLHSVKDVVKVDDATVDVVTKSPNPIFSDELTSIMMMSKAWAEKHSVQTTQDYKNKQETYAVRNANGTGPFKLVSREPDVKTVLARNADWWGNTIDRHNVDEIVYTPIASPSTRVAALLSGELDFVSDPPLQDVPRIQSTPGLKIQKVAQDRAIFYGFDIVSPELRVSDVKGKNPFSDKRVRQAIYQAIDIEAIKAKVMRGDSAPSGIVAAPTIRGWTKELDARPKFDDAAAKKLLADAGYPNGFTTKLDCPNDRYANDEAICQATVGMLARIGIKVQLDSQSKSLHFPKIQKKTSDFYLLGWGVPTLDSHYVFSFLYGTKGAWNFTGYSSEKMDGLIEAMSSEMDATKRLAIIADAWKQAREDLLYVPLHNQVVTWATSDKIDIPILPNDRPQFRYAVFK
jgi:peptide/nickel transport system substrate-binding protein